MNPPTDVPSELVVPPPRRMPDGSIRGYHVEEYVIPAEVLPDLSKLVIEDDVPVDNIFAEKQQRLLTEPLYSSWKGPEEGGSFLALANVGLFYQRNTPAMAPDVMLSLGVKLGDDLSVRENRSYYIWELGKPPDVVIEFVSDRTGGEEDYKLHEYAHIRVAYYVILDPQERLGAGPLRAFELVVKKYRPTNPSWLEGIGLGLTFWEGPFEGHPWRWLRWCDRQGQVIPTGSETIALQRQQIEQERQHRERLEAQLRALGIEPAP
jgi:hypothetical protein